MANFSELSSSLSFTSSSHMSNGSISHNISNSSVAEAGTSLEVISLNKLSSSLEQLLIESTCEYSDADIVVEGIAVGVHRCILASRSKFFHELFRREKGSLEKDGKPKYCMSELLPYGNVGYEAFLIFLSYLYTGKLKPSPMEVSTCVDNVCAHDSCRPAITFAVELMYASSIFQVPELVSLFQRRLLNFVRKALAEDVIPILVVAFHCQSSQLIAQCVDRIAVSNLDNISIEKELPHEVADKIKQLRRKPISDDENNTEAGDPLREKRIKRIHMALDSDDVELVKLLLTESDISLDDANALHYCASYCDLKVMSEVLSLGLANVNLRNSRGYTVLHIAAMRKEPSVIVSLLAKGASALDLTSDGQSAVSICRRLTRPKDYHAKTEQGQEANKDRLCIDILEREMRRNPLGGSASITSHTMVDDLHMKLLYLENRVAFARLFFPTEAKLAMDIAHAATTSEFAGLAASKGSSGNLREVDLNETPIMQNKRLRSRMEALMKTVEMGRRYFPNCSEVLDKFMEDDLPDLFFLEKGTPDEQRIKRTRFMEQSSEGMHLNLQQPRNPIAHVSINNKSEKILNIASVLDVSSKKIGSKTSNLSEVFIASENCEVIDLDAGDVTGDKNVGDSGSSHSTSILDKLFGSALTLNGTASTGPSSFIEHHDVKVDDTWSPKTGQSSKFAQWFSEEEKKPVDNLPSGRPNDLLSLIVGGEKGGSQVKATDHMLPTFPFQSSELEDRHLSSNLKPVSVENNAKRSNTDKPDVVPAVLTCEDLEQSILSEITENGSTLLPPVHGWSGGHVKIEQQKAEYHASQHLLSLLQKGTGLDNAAPSANLGISQISVADRLQNTEVANPSNAPRKPRDADAENIPNPGKALTLETLFGTAFMKELQSVGAPVSSQRDSVGHANDNASEFHGLPVPVIDDGFLPPAEIVLSMSSHRSGVLASKQRQQIVSDRTGEHLLGFDPQNEVDSSHLRTELGSKIGGFDGSVEIRLPEEDNLIAVSGPLNLQNFLLARNSAKSELLQTPGTSVDIAEKLAALNSGFRDERPVAGQEGQPFLRGPYDMREPDAQFHNLHVQSSSSQLHPPQLNHPGPMFHPLGSHPANMNAQMKLVAPENIHHDAPNNQFPANMLRPPFNHPSRTLTGFDPSTHKSVLPQMHMHGNFPPAHLQREFPRGAPLPPHPSNQVTGFMQEPGPMQGFPFGQRQPNFGALGTPPQAIDVGGESHHPEALQRLIEMELRSKSKQAHPFAASGNGPGIYGHELDMGFGYR